MCVRMSAPGLKLAAQAATIRCRGAGGLQPVHTLKKRKKFSKQVHRARKKI
jgi:hypothetical protein